MTKLRLGETTNGTRHFTPFIRDLVSNSLLKGLQALVLTEKLSLIHGFICIGVGVVLNPKFIEATLVPDGHIESLFYIALIVGGQLSAALLGFYIIIQRGRKFTRLAWFTFSAITALLLAEIGLQMFYEPRVAISGWRSFASRGEVNQVGFRGRTIEYAPEDFVIVLLGDSQVEARACAFGWIPENRLEHHLKALGKKVKIYSVGTLGYGQDQQLLAMQDYYQKYRADLVVLWLTPLNDIWNNIFPTHFGAAKPTFWLENGVLKGPSEGMGQKLPSSSVRLLGLLRQVIGIQLNRDKEWEARLPKPYQPMLHHDGAVKDDWQRQWSSNFAGIRNDNFENEKNHRAIFFTPRSERMLYGLDLTRHLLDQIKSLVHRNNGSLVIFTSDPPVDAAAFDGVYILNRRYYQASMAQFKENLAYLQQGLVSYAIPVTVADWQVGLENRHLNEHATDQVMEDLARVLINRIPST